MYSIIWFCQDSREVAIRKTFAGLFFIPVNEEKRKNRSGSSCKRLFGVPRVFNYQVVCHVSIVKGNVKKQEGSAMGRRSSIVKFAGNISRKRIAIGRVNVMSGRWLVSW
jgi:hypothetical protein